MSALSNALSVLQASSVKGKCEAASYLAKQWQHNKIISPITTNLPDNPGRPETPTLVSPSHVPRRRLGSVAGRAALLHAVAHIEFNAIDLAADMIVRFGLHPDIAKSQREDFIEDWISVCHDEARHFMMLENRLHDLDIHYGSLPAHNGLWEAAIKTKDNFAARLAIAPMVLEARGLDVTPGMIKKLNKIGDLESSSILKTIYNDEIDHVAIGAKWFKVLAESKNKQPEQYFHKLVSEFYTGHLKPPFNVQARTLAGLKQGFYMPLT